MQTTIIYVKLDEELKSELEKNTEFPGGTGSFSLKLFEYITVYKSGIHISKFFFPTYIHTQKKNFWHVGGRYF